MRKGTCKHFSGIQHDTCDKGYIYLAVARPLTNEESAWHNDNYPGRDPVRTALAHRTPCHAENGVTTCPDYEEPTQAELDEQERRIQVAMEQTFKARAAIVNHIEVKGLKKRSIQDKLQCPICEDGTLHFSYAGSYNGHIHAKCTTDGCVNWME